MDITKIAAGIGMLQKFVGKAALNPRATAAVFGAAGGAAGGAMAGDGDTALMAGAAGAVGGALGGKALVAGGIKSLNVKGKQYVAEGIKANVKARPAAAASGANAAASGTSVPAAAVAHGTPEAVRQAGQRADSAVAQMAQKTQQHRMSAAPTYSTPVSGSANAPASGVVSGAVPSSLPNAATPPNAATMGTPETYTGHRTRPRRAAKGYEQPEVKIAMYNAVARILGK